MPEPGPIPPLDLSALSFLVVEDDSFQRWALERMLLNAGVTRVRCTPDGQAALDALEHEGFDVLICDLEMPNVDGIELIRRLGSGPRVPAVVVCTAHDEPLVAAVAAIARVHRVSIIGAIAKPITPAKLFATLAAYASAFDEASPPSADVPDLHAGMLDAALKREEIHAWFQPKIDMATGRVAGGEALARWTLPSGTTLLPGQFIPALEREGFGRAFNALIVRQAIHACAAWRRQGLTGSVSINIDAIALADESLVDALTAAVLEQGLCTGDVVLEVTESTAAATSPGGLETLTRLRMRGFGLAMDDFGTGYSSMMQLVSLPFTEIKIDRSFVQGALNRRTCRAVVRSCADIAASLGIRCVAEGVETDAQWSLVRELGCSDAQGWRFGRAMPWAQFAGFARQVRDTPLRARP